MNRNFFCIFLIFLWSRHKKGWETMLYAVNWYDLPNHKLYTKCDAMRVLRFCHLLWESVWRLNPFVCSWIDIERDRKVFFFPEKGIFLSRLRLIIKKGRDTHFQWIEFQRSYYNIITNYFRCYIIGKREILMMARILICCYSMLSCFTSFTSSS